MAGQSADEQIEARGGEAERPRVGNVRPRERRALYPHAPGKGDRTRRTRPE